MRVESIGKSKTNANKTPIAIDLRSQSGASQHLRASKPPNHPSSLDGRTPTRSPFRSSHVPTMEPTLVWISSEEDAGDTESDTDSFSIFDQGSELSQQTTMGSISSLTPESPTKVTLRPSSGLLSTREHAASHPIVTDNFTLSPSQLLNNTPMSPSDEDFFACSATISSPSERLPPPIPSVNSPPIPGYVPSPMPDSPHYFVIAHDKETQKLFDDLTGPVSWGAQYELARGVSLKEWTWEDVRKKVHHFAGKSDAEAMHLVCYIMKNVTLPKFLKNDIGQESDREQFAILENCNRGLGLMGHLHGVDDWFGGQIQQTATLRESARRTLFLQLEPLEMRRSTRFARQFGSRRIIMVRIPDELLLDRARQHTISFLSRKFVLNGRIYAPTPPKEHAVYLVEINEDYERTAVRKFGDQHRMSLREVLEWHNPMALNSQQPVSKYAARAALALSNSVPSLIFNVEDIQFIDDIIASDCTEKKPPASKVLTDGCGFMNEAALKAIATALNYASRPTAVQGRIAGSKGLWTIHPDKNVNSSDVPQIWIRESQRKIVYPDLDSSRKHYKSLDRVHRIFDLCHAALPTPSTAGSMVSLSKHSVLNLWANGVPIEIFKELMEKGLQETIEPLIQWDGQFAMPALWDAINKAGKISHMRTARLGAGMARALGLAGRDYSKEGSTQSEAGASPIFSSTVTGRNEMSGAPVALQETAIELVQAGFHPAKDFMLWSTLQKVLEVTVQGAIDKCSIPLPEGSAATAFHSWCIDPLGVLDENEIYYRSSTPIRNPHTRTLFHVITGEMLIFRYPLRVSSDTQKVNAVDKPELAPWSDVFIVPIKPSDSGQGLLSMMSKCSGGDQDGDDLCGIWLDCLVKSFKVSPLVLEPKDISSNFERKVEKVDDFLTRLKSVADAEPKLISTFLEGLTNFNVGLYNEFHDKAVRHNGYDSAAAIRLAFLFNRLLDAPKTGAMLHSTVLREDSAQNRTFKESLECRERSGLQKSFIFDELGTFGQGLLKTTMAKFEQLPTSSEKSHILLEPYRMAQNLCRIGGIPTGPAEKIAQASGLDSGNVMRILQEARRLDLRLIEQHVDQAFHKFCFIVDTTKGLQEKKKKKKGKSTQPDTMGPVIALYTQEIHGLTNTLPNIDQVKASYAYSKSKTHNFGKTVAFRTLCEIQVAASSEGGAPCSRLLDQVKSVSGGARRLF
ncbi:RNA dependent RNA polymerase-domain-containing protein [Lentinula aciculospora]|uniref:RNA-dependent RNA polymerase n=1 Tax=Lentinula aciculospora TaxID=153920 RepID=A0A9W9AIY1_9AGAR|nr:RNA dependent RNA polymerase-domain-containing protein [Lentinula aciculospora]